MYNFIAYVRYIYAQRKQLFFLCALLGNQLMISMDTKNVVFPKDFLELSKMAKSMVGDIGESAEIMIPLPASKKTINDVFSIFALHNGEDVRQSAIRKEIEWYPLDRLVYIANLLQHLDVPDGIMEAVMDQIAHILGNILDSSLKSLYQPSQNVIIPSYEALRDLNRDVERMIKKNFQIQQVLQWRIDALWKFFGRGDFNQQIEQFKQGDETIASFLDRNVMHVMKQFIDQKKQEVFSNNSPSNNQRKDNSTPQNNNEKIALGAIIAAATIAGLWKLYNYISQEKQ